MRGRPHRVGRHPPPGPMLWAGRGSLVQNRVTTIAVLARHAAPRARLDTVCPHQEPLNDKAHAPETGRENTAGATARDVQRVCGGSLADPRSNTWRRPVVFGCLEASGKSRSPGPVSPGSECVQQRPGDRQDIPLEEAAGTGRFACPRPPCAGLRWPSTLAKQKGHRMRLPRPTRPQERERQSTGLRQQPPTRQNMHRRGEGGPRSNHARPIPGSLR